MEGLLFLGLMGSGYVYNNMSKDQSLNTDEGSDKKPVVSSPEIPDITQRTSVYTRDSTVNKPQYIKNQNNQVSQFKQFNLDTTPAIQKLNSPIEVTQPEKIQSEISDDYIDRMDFLTNDQGIRIQPHFKGSGPGLPNINNNGLLESSQGYDIKMKKSEVAPFFAPSKNSGNVYGSTFDGAVANKHRYDINQYRQNDLAFEQQHVSPIDSKSGINQEVSRLYSDRRSTQNIRTLNNQKDTYEGRIIPGKHVDQRGLQAQVDKNRPYRDYENSPLRNFTTVGETQGPTSRATEILKPTNRTFLNKSELGVASGNGLENAMKRPLVQKTMKTALGTSTQRNAISEVPQLLDYKRLGYVARPNERQVTVERTYEGPIKSYIDEHEVGLLDKVKTTKRQTTMYSDLRNPASYVSEDTSRLNYCNMETDPTKEIVSKEREPTLSNVKLTNGADTINMDIKKLDSDSVTQYMTGIDKVYGKIPTDFNCQLTQEKETLDNKKLADRIYPEQLDAFRKNPLTHPLTSYAYN